MSEIAKSFIKYKICVSGAARTDCCASDAMEKTKELSRQIVKQGGMVMTGATTGVPYWAAIGAKEAGGICIGFSPAASEQAHIKTYHLPIDYHDVIVYTGFEYAGRNLVLTRASDAVVIVCGRLGTLNEFTIAFEDKKPIGILTETGGMADEIKGIVDKGHRGSGKIIYDCDPKKLIAKLIKAIQEERSMKVEFAPGKGGGE